MKQAMHLVVVLATVLAPALKRWLRIRKWYGIRAENVQRRAARSHPWSDGTSSILDSGPGRAAWSDPRGVVFIPRRWETADTMCWPARCFSPRAIC